MTNIKVQIHDDVVTIINLVKETNDSGLTLDIPKGAAILENALNLKLIKKEAEKYGKNVEFETQDEYGQNLIELIEDATQRNFTISPNENTDTGVVDVSDSDIESGGYFVSLLNSIASIPKRLWGDKGPGYREKKGFPLKIVLLLLILLVGGIYGCYYYINNVPKANIKLVVNSNPLTKSVQVRVTVEESPPELANTLVLEGILVETTASKIDKRDTTGEKIIGDRAEGKVKIFNKTLSEVTFDKGTELENDEGQKYLFKDDVTVPAATEETEEETNESGEVVGENVITTFGTAEVRVEAEDIGNSYNMDDDEDIEFDDFSNNDYTAEIIEDIDGGSSETLKVVTQQDLDDIKQKLLDDYTQEAEQIIKDSLPDGRVYINGSQVVTVTNEIYSHELDEETEDIELTLEVVMTGLAYRQNALEKLIENEVQEFVPKGFELHTQDTDIDVQILGNTDSAVLTPTAADLQVTIRTTVITQIEEDQIISELVGVSYPEAQRILGSIPNVETYEIDLNPNIKLLTTMPRKSSNISLELVKQ